MTEDSSLGVVDRRVPLRGRVPLASGQKAQAELCLSDTGLWLVAEGKKGARLLVDVLAADPLRYLPGRLGDRLQVGEHQLGIPTGKGAAVQQAIALARLRGTQAASWPEVAAFAEERTPLDEAWASGWLREGERILAWLETGSSVQVDSWLGAASKEEQRFVLTTERAALVAIGPLGDAQVAELERRPLEVKAQLGRDLVCSGELRWRTTRRNDAAFRELAELPGCARSERVLRGAARLWARQQRDAEAAAEARRWLGWLVEDGDPWGALTIATIRPSAEGLGEVDASLRAIAVVADPARRLVDWVDDWTVPFERAIELGDRLAALGLAGEASVALYQAALSSLPADDEDPAARVERELGYARHLLEARRAADAVTVLETTLATLPEAELLDLLPPPENEPDAGAQALRLRVLDELAVLRGGEDGRDADTLLELAKLQPLADERVTALAQVADEALAPRVAELAAMLAPGGLNSADGMEGHRVVRPTRAWSEEQLFEQVQHPAARKGGALGKLQAFLATVEVPDRSALKSYCQHLQPSISEAAHQALTDAALALGTRSVEAYVSRGERSIGLRAHEGTPSFVLIGGEHLDPDSPFFLGPVELRFAIGAEMAHLRLGHARVTSSEVWAGAYEKSVETASLLLSVLPALRVFRFGSKIATVADKLPEGAVGAVIDTAGKWVGSGAKAEGRTLGNAPDEVVAAHRVTQLTADRAGLVLAADLAAAIRAMFLTRPEYQPELAVVERTGLSAAVSRRDQQHELLYPDLAVRVGALLAFYLSADYPAASAAIRG